MKNKCTKFACAIIIEYFCNIITKGRLDMKLRTAFIFLSILGASLMGHTQNNRNLFRCNPNDIYSLLNEGLQSQLEHRFDKRQVLDPKSTLLSYEEQLWTDGRFVLSTFYNHKARVIQAGFNRFMEPTPGMEKPHELTVAGKKAKVKGNSQLYATVEKLGNYTMLVYRNAQGTPLKAYYKISIDDVNNRTWTIFLHYILDGNYMLSNDENTVFGIKQDFYTGKKYNTDPGIYQFYLHPEDNSIDIEYGEGRVSHGDPSSPKYGKMPGGGGAAAIMGPMEWQLKLTAQGLEARVTRDEKFVDHSPRLNNDGPNVLTKVQCPWQGVDGKWAFASVMPLTHELLKLFPKDVLELMRAEIYARHGDTFKSVASQQYFDEQPWYEKSNKAVVLTDIEKFNAALIKEVMANMK